MTHEQKTYRAFTIFWSAIVAGVTSLVLAYFTSHEVTKGVERNQDRIAQAQANSTQEQVDACIRGGIARTDKYSYYKDERTFVIYMASQEHDPEIAQGWDDKAKYLDQHIADVEAEAKRIGFVLPGTVMNDCVKVVATR